LKARIEESQNQEGVESVQEDVKSWKDELERLEKLIPMDNQLSSIRDVEIPELEKQLKEEKDRLPGLVSQHEKVDLATA
jgi:hypothetical protein